MFGVMPVVMINCKSTLPGLTCQMKLVLYNYDEIAGSVHLPNYRVTNFCQIFGMRLSEIIHNLSL